jgi:hypothetical protein
MWELSAAICASHYKTKTTIKIWQALTVPGSCILTAVETAEHLYTECAAKHWDKQSLCTSFDENAVTHSVLLGLKNVRRGGALIFKFFIRAILSGLKHFCHFSIDRVYIVGQLKMFLHMPIS